MIDITIIGGGSAARACTDLLTAAGFGLRRTFEFDDEDRSPIVLGELPNAAAVAREAVDSGRHLLIANPSQLSPERISSLFEARRRAQALFLFSTRRFHPSYRFVSSLLEADSTWQPRHLRHETLITGTPSPALAAWTLVETIALVSGLTGSVPVSVSATGAAHPLRSVNELMDLSLEYPRLRAFLLVALGEAMERRETLIAGQDRRLFIDELNQSVPVRLIAEDTGRDHPAARWLSTSAPSAEEMVRQQVLAFLDSTLQPSRVQEEAELWTGAFAVVTAARQSLLQDGAAVAVLPHESETARFRLLPSIA